MVSQSRDPADFHIRQLSSDIDEHRAQARERLSEMLTDNNSKDKQSALLRKIMAVKGAAPVIAQVGQLIGRAALGLTHEFPKILDYFKQHAEVPIAEFLGSAARLAEAQPSYFKDACSIMFERTSQMSDCLGKIRLSYFPGNRPHRGTLATVLEEMATERFLPVDVSAQIKLFVAELKAPISRKHNEVIDKLLNVGLSMDGELVTAQIKMLDQLIHDDAELDTVVDWALSKVFVYRFERDFSEKFSDSSRVSDVVQTTNPTHVFLPELRAGFVLRKSDPTPTAEMLAEEISALDRGDAVSLVDSIRGKVVLVGLGGGVVRDDVRNTQRDVALREASKVTGAKILIVDYQRDSPIIDSFAEGERPAHVGECVLLEKACSHPAVRIVRAFMEQASRLGLDSSSMVIPVRVNNELRAELGEGDLYDFRQYDIVALRVSLDNATKS
jgi:hypothetical protein